MKSLISIAIVTMFTLNAHAGLQAIKGSKNKITIKDSEYERVVNSNTPVCVKDGGSVMGVNDAFNNLRLKSRDCSEGDGAVAKHEALGIKVTVIKFKELSLAKRKELLSK